MAKKYSKNRIPQFQERKPLTKYERWIFTQIRQNFLSPKQILTKRNKLSQKRREDFKIPERASLPALSKSIKKICLKLNISSMISREKPEFIQKWLRETPWRLHAKAMTIKIKGTSHSYSNIRLKHQNKDVQDNNTIILNKNSLTVYSNKDFFGETPDDAIERSELYWNHFLRVLEQKYNIILFKGGIEIYEFRNHLAHINNPLKIKELSSKKKNVVIKDSLGRIRIVMDGSFNFDELEFVEKTLYKDDANRTNEFILDLVEKPDSKNLSEVTKDINTLNSSNQTIYNNILQITSSLQKHTDITTINSSQVALILQIQKNNALEIKTLTSNMSQLIKLITPKKIESNLELSKNIYL